MKYLSELSSLVLDLSYAVQDISFFFWLATSLENDILKVQQHIDYSG